MKKPQKPPRSDLGGNATWLRAVLEALSNIGNYPPDPYLPWDEVRRRTAPGRLTHEQWWQVLRMRRRGLAKKTPLHDHADQAFTYSIVDPMPERLREIDLQAGGTIEMDEPIVDRDLRDRYYVSSLIDEAITSSQLEGASTTRKIADEMLRTQRPPRDRSERMISNNFLTMRRIVERKHEELTVDTVLELQRLITDQTLDDPSASGRLRRSDERVVVADEYGEVMHDPPPATEIAHRMERMCAFANQRGTGAAFVHPAIRAIILHFWLAYDHPFVDGNGRTARALFYWSMLNQGYWLFEFVSISQVILKAPVQYGMAFLHTETDENDLNYFVLYHLDVIRRSVEALHAYLKNKAAELRRVEKHLSSSAALNERQRALIAKSLRHPGRGYTIAEHKNTYRVVYETARTDLLDLEKRGLFISSRIGRRFVFTPVKDLERRLGEL